jgi:hypothetical protein
MSARACFLEFQNSKPRDCGWLVPAENRNLLMPGQKLDNTHTFMIHVMLGIRWGRHKSNFIEQTCQLIFLLLFLLTAVQAN